MQTVKTLSGQFLSTEKVADRISRWRPEDGPLLYVVDSSFTDDAPDVQKFDVNSKGETLKMKDRAVASRYTVGPIATWDEYSEEVSRLRRFVNKRNWKSILVFQSTSPIAAVYVGMRTVFEKEGSDSVNDFVKQFDDPKYGVDLAPYWRHIIHVADATISGLKLGRTISAIRLNGSMSDSGLAAIISSITSKKKPEGSK